MAVTAAVFGIRCRASQQRVPHPLHVQNAAPPSESATQQPVGRAATTKACHLHICLQLLLCRQGRMAAAWAAWRHPTGVQLANKRRSRCLAGPGLLSSAAVRPCCHPFAFRHVCQVCQVCHRPKAHQGPAGCQHIAAVLLSCRRGGGGSSTTAPGRAGRHPHGIQSCHRLGWPP